LVRPTSSTPPQPAQCTDPTILSHTTVINRGIPFSADHTASVAHGAGAGQSSRIRCSARTASHERAEHRVFLARPPACRAFGRRMCLVTTWSSITPSVSSYPLQVPAIVLLQAPSSTPKRIYFLLLGGSAGGASLSVPQLRT
jgi:hypothetical protein